ncbi:MAG: hypothetical protein ACYDAK_12500 [Candidatus Limnocylindrales bacterium]
MLEQTPRFRVEPGPIDGLAVLPFYIASPPGPTHLAFLLARADSELTLRATLVLVKPP